MLHHHIQAFDEERDVNFDEVWDEELVLTLLDKKKYKKYWCWLSQIDLKTSENQGEIENPRTLTLPIGSDIVLDRKSTRLNSSHITRSRMPSSA